MKPAVLGINGVAAKLYQKNGDVLLNGKAYNSRVVLEWLSETVYAASAVPEYVGVDGRFLLISAALWLGRSVLERLGQGDSWHAFLDNLKEQDAI